MGIGRLGNHGVLTYHHDGFKIFYGQVEIYLNQL
jgi:hypothetical protein